MEARSVPRNRREADQFRMFRGPDSSKSSGLGANLPSNDRNQVEKDASLRVRKQFRVAKAPQRRGPVSGLRSSLHLRFVQENDIPSPNHGRYR